MRSIEIKTSHNIILKFQLATIMQRILASIIDFIIIYLYAALISLMRIFSGGEIGFYIFILPAFLVYHLLFELFNNGQTIGKRALKIRVISLDGKSVSLRSSIIRWAFRLVDIGISLGVIAYLSIFSSEKSQRIGDLLANTTVVSLSNTTFNTIKSLTRLDNIAHEITYPGIVMYNDEDMVLVKETIKRHRIKPNNHSLQLCQDLAIKIKTDLGMEEHQKVNTIQFLNTVVDDYIMLTR